MAHVRHVSEGAEWLDGTVVVVNLASRKRELVYWVVLCSDPTVVPVVVWHLFTSTYVWGTNMLPNLAISIPARPLVLGRASSFLLAPPPGPPSLAGASHRDANEHKCSAVPLRVAVVPRCRRP